MLHQVNIIFVQLWQHFVLLRKFVFQSR